MNKAYQSYEYVHQYISQKAYWWLYGPIAMNNHYDPWNSKL